MGEQGMKVMSLESLQIVRDFKSAQLDCKLAQQVLHDTREALTQHLVRMYDPKPEEPVSFIIIDYEVLVIRWKFNRWDVELADTVLREKALG